MSLFTKYFLPVVLVISLVSCKKETQLNRITIQDLSAEYIGNQQVRVIYKRIKEGNVTVLSSGVIFSSDPKADFFNYKIYDETFTTGEINQIYGSTEAELTFYIRPFVVTKRDTILGEVVSVLTGKYYEEGAGVTDIDGNFYPTVKLGSQEWMAADLKTRRFCNGDSIPFAQELIASHLIDSSFSSTNFREPNGAENTGLIYNFYAAMDERNICPCGWKVPTDSDWFELIVHLGNDQYVGGKLKSTGTREGGDGYWSAPNKSANNLSGMNVNPGGYLENPNVFNNIQSRQSTLGYRYQNQSNVTLPGFIFVAHNDKRARVEKYSDLYSYKFFFTYRCIKE